MTKISPFLKRLAIGWLLLVALWMIWGAATYGGLYRWLCEWQLAVNGEYSAFLSFTVPILLFATPVVLFLRLQFDPTSIVPPKPLGPAASERLVTRVLGTIALGGAVVCASAWCWAQHYPDPSGKSVDVDLSKLGDAAPPLGRVTLIGSIDADHVVKKTIDAKGTGGRDLYAPVVVTGASKPGRIFVSEYADNAINQPLPTEGGDRFRGVLVEGGLHGDTLRQFAKLGVPIAEPYYVLLTSPEGSRADSYVIAGLGGFIALIGVLPLAVLFLTKGKRLRKTS
jgi:hypothetical protein